MKLSIKLGRRKITKKVPSHPLGGIDGLEDYLGCNPEPWIYELEEATHKAEAKFSDGWWENGFGVLGDGEDEGDTAIRWECKELKNERTEGGFEWWEY